MSPSTSANWLALRILDRMVRISCRGSLPFDLLAQTYGAMRCENSANVDLDYVVDGNKNRGFRITRVGREPLLAHDDGEFLFLFEKDMTIELQRLRQDLYFVHAAAVEFRSTAALLVGAS